MLPRSNYFLNSGLPLILFRVQGTMPFDSNTFLRDQGWEGSGRGLRDGALSKPLAPAQKRTLAGLGKDRDEAFPFWDQ
jgi:hypothetical protein